MTESLVARTSLGDMQGTRHGGVAQFRGVPYAAPPVGELRFAPPRRVSAWTGARDARQHGPIAPQRPSRLRAAMGDMPSAAQGEDCLTLTISAPAIDGGSRPVLVWLHGGAYMSGAGSLDWYDGAALARDGDVVVVGVNYRLGALGFLYHPGLSDGTLGLLDIIAALTWVREHIAAFGGDPDRITIMGQSAGAHAILCLLTMPDARRLFRRAILQSAPAGLPPLSAATASERGDRLLALLAIDRGHPPDVAARVKAEPAERFLEATGALARATARFGQVVPPFMPVIDHLADPARFLDSAAEGAGAARVDLIVGTTREEANAFFCDPSAQEHDPDAAQLAGRFAALAGHEDAIERYRQRRPGGRAVDLLSDLVTDYTFLFPSLRFAEAAAEAGARVWVYQFDWAPPGTPFKACHCLELPFVFGNPHAWRGAPMVQGAAAAELADLSAVIRGAWTGFARTGEPTACAPWPEYRAWDRQTMRFASVIGPVGDPAGAAWRRAPRRAPRAER
ncbi:carboxylesterase [Sorangium cellulosum]|uniref:Carboxylic ester hydrolase n=1 Tax=Sorangium cellulosum TaxID=56 RepID=A0A2L0EI15_SORCE|nr:carboxylesterase family protein [Sorangium cellulosum]AUX38926.1 carboxylesterase [Sorangium cellulosum]